MPRPAAGIVFAQVKVRGQFLGAPSFTERGSSRTGCQQGLGEDFSGWFYKLHHL